MTVKELKEALETYPENMGIAYMHTHYGPDNYYVYIDFTRISIVEEIERLDWPDAKEVFEATENSKEIVVLI